MKVTTDQVRSKIKSESYLVLPDGRSTLCVLILQNGFTVTAVSHCANAADFSMDIGRKIAFEDAFNKVWAFEAYVLQQKMYEKTLVQMNDLSDIVEGMIAPQVRKRGRPAGSKNKPVRTAKK